MSMGMRGSLLLGIIFSKGRKKYNVNKRSKRKSAIAFLLDRIDWICKFLLLHLFPDERGEMEPASGGRICDYKQ